MCGIIAAINHSRKKTDLISARNTMLHRGPDYQNDLFINDTTYFGHNRLSIIDLNDRSNQPFVSDQFYMIYNGEVYNYKELIIDHKLIVKTSSDTEVVLEMYKKYGPSCVEYFNGMFTIIIYNNKKNEFFVARDRLGIKPLYYYINNKEWLFASEIRPIQDMVNSKIDDFGLRQYRKLRMTLKGYTIYEDIKFFPPGHFMQNGKLIKYWDLDISNKTPPQDSELKYLIEDSVRLRKRSDVEVGSYLSGGLDSTILSYLLEPNHTWTVGFEELNEFDWSEIASKKLTSSHNKIIVNNDIFLKTAKSMIKKRKEPLSVPNEVLIYLMTKKVKSKNTVILSGEGADELFWGYDRIFRWAENITDLNYNEFDEKYCYGSNKDLEVIDFALENLPGVQTIDKIGYFFQIHHLHGLLRRLDNSTMLCSVEARVPFVDHRLVELMGGTPFNWRMGKSFKEPLKRIFSSILPPEIINRKKVGFPVPIENIFSYNKLNGTAMDKWLVFNLCEINKIYN